MPEGLATWTRHLASFVCAAGLNGLLVMPAAADATSAEASIQRSIQLRRDSADAEALEVLLDAEKQEPTSVRLLMHIVTAAQAAGKWLVADRYLKKVSQLSEDPYFKQYADAIDGVRRAVAARVGSLQVEGNPDGASVYLNGHRVGSLPMQDPAPTEAGAYVMEVRKPGFYPLRRNVTINGGVMTREPVQLNPAQERSGVLMLAGGEADSANGEQVWWQTRAVGWSLLGVGVASGVVSAIAFADREKNAERWNDDRCLPDDGTTRQFNCASFRNSAESAESVGIVTGVVGVLMAGAGAAHLLVLSREDADMSEQANAAQVTRCGAGILSLSCEGSF